MPIIPPSILDLLRTGVSVLVGTRDASLMPECARAWGIRVEHDLETVTLFLTEAASRKTLENLRDNGLIAVTCCRPTDHVTCQLKGRVRRIRTEKQRDRVDRLRWRRAFLEEDHGRRSSGRAGRRIRHGAGGGRRGHGRGRVRADARSRRRRESVRP